MCDSFPIIRTGRLAAAKEIPSGKRIIANYDQGERVLESFNEQSENIETRLLNALKENIPDIEIINSADNPFPDQVRLQNAQRSRSFSPIFDFSDHLIRSGELLVLIRACVTVCTAETVLGFAPDNVEDHRSKFWTRAACVAINKSLATDVTDTELNAFADFSKNISAISNDALRVPYQEAFSSAVEKEVEIDLNETFTFFAVGSDDRSFNSFYRELRDGSNFRELMGKKAAERLLEVASLAKVFPESSHKDNQLVLANAAENENLQLFVFEDSRHYRGVFVGKKEIDSALFVGLAHFPDSPDDDILAMRLNKGSLSQQPSVRVSAQAINEIAMRL